MDTDPVVVVGAGPGGLAAAAALGRRDVPAIVLERSDDVGASWREHYDRLHLHTTRRLSGLPGLAIPREAGRWVARDDVVRYLEAYAVHHRLDVHARTEVTSVERDGDRWAVACDGGGVLTAADVVVATGYNHTPLLPAWPGVGSFTGRLLHASEYRDARPYAGSDVLVVGVGNTGAEIAVDLAEGGAARVRIAVRTPPHVVRRSVAGWPAQGTGIVVRHLPVGLVDHLARAIARVEVPDLTAYGLPRPETGLYTRVMAGAVPVQDVGLLAGIRARRIEPVPAVARFDGDDVVLADGRRLAPDVVIAATGYRHGLESLVGSLGILDDRGLPTVHGPRTSARAPGLYFTGYTNPISGMLRELRLDANRIADRVARGRRRAGARPPTPSGRRP